MNNKKLKILQLVTKRQYRGAEVFAANLSTELIKLGHEVFFVGLYKNKTNILEVEGAENLDLIDEKTGIISLTVINKLRNIVISRRPDIIQCNGSDTLKYMVAASFYTATTPILYRNISMISEWVTNRPKKILYKFLLKRISHVSSVGDQAIEDFIKTFDFPEEKTSVIRRGIPMKKVDSDSAKIKLISELRLKEDDKIVIHVGNFSPEKNHLYLLDIFASIKQVSPDVKLVCVGDGIMFQTIVDEIRKRNLEDTIFLLGFRKDIPELIAASNCLCLCSKVEGVPGVILEAAIQKKPAVATNVGGVKEVLIDGKTGFLIDDFNKVMFINKLARLAKDKELCENMGERAQRLVLENFDPFKNAKRFEALYTSLIDKKI